MSDFNEGRHPLSPRSNSKVVPPYIPPPRKESLEAEALANDVNYAKMDIAQIVSKHIQANVPPNTKINVDGLVNDIEGVCVALNKRADNIRKDFKL